MPILSLLLFIDRKQNKIEVIDGMLSSDAED
jgi:hypothetical protein